MKGCTIEAFYWMSFPPYRWVSVVVERMYDWSRTRQRLSLLWIAVSVVVERMYDWSFLLNVVSPLPLSFSCCWKDVRLKHDMSQSITIGGPSFSCCWKDVRLKRDNFRCIKRNLYVSVVVERMYDWSVYRCLVAGSLRRFSCCWKDVRLKLRNQLIENKWFLTVGFWSVFRKWSICTKSAIIFENLGWFGWLLDCFW